MTEKGKKEANKGLHHLHRSRSNTNMVSGNTNRVKNKRIKTRKNFQFYAMDPLITLLLKGGYERV
jgi:hypothetical protein